MRQKIGMAVLGFTLIVVALTPRMLAQAPPPVSLEDQLKAQYTVVKMGADSGGPAVIEQGTILVVKKGGILSVPYSEQPVATKYQDGAVHPPSALMMGARGGLMGKLGRQQSTQFYQVGIKVYPSRIMVNMAKDQVIVGLIACDSCNNVSPTTFNKAEVVFQFPKGTLPNTSPSEVEDTISGLLNIDDSAGGDQGNGQQGGNGNNQQGNNQQGNNQQGNNQAGGGQAQQPPQPPQQIEKGQTPDQVVAAIGQPDKIVNLGAKQLYVYKDIKVTFLNGKVVDVQ